MRFILGFKCWNSYRPKNCNVELYSNVDGIRTINLKLIIVLQWPEVCLLVNAFLIRSGKGVDGNSQALMGLNCGVHRVFHHLISMS